MTEYERGYREALEAAAHWHDCEAWPDSPQEAFHLKSAAAIRALASRIQSAKPCHCRLAVGAPCRVCDNTGCIRPAPDDEVMSRLVAASEAPAGCDGLGEVRVRVSDLRAVVDALRNAGALRHE